LTQLPGAFSGVSEDARYDLGRLGEDGLPCFRVGPRHRPVAEPARHSLPRALDEHRLFEKAYRNGPVQLQTRALGEGM
jgi:hypothetical protein